MTRLLDAIHIGFPKTGTTWLQQVAIPQMQVASLGKPAMIDVEYYYWFQELLACDALDFDAGRFRERFAHLHRLHESRLPTDTVRLASFELLSGELYAGQDSQDLLDRVHGIFGTPKVIITIREQTAMVESLYRHYIASGGSLHIREFVYKIMSPCVDVWGNRKLLQRFRYDLVADDCRRRFGADNVLVLPFELIKRGPAAFVGPLCAFLDIDCPSAEALKGRAENPSLSSLGTSALRMVNQFISTPWSDSPLFRGVPATYSRFSNRVFRPLDGALLRHLSRKRRFVDVRQKWPVRRYLKRVVGPMVRTPLEPTEGSDRDIDRRLPSGALLNLVRFLDWPEKNQSLRLGSTRYAATLDDRTIAQAVREAYADSNRRTQQMTGQPLDELGYEVGPG